MQATGELRGCVWWKVVHGWDRLQKSVVMSDMRESEVTSVSGVVQAQDLKVQRSRRKLFTQLSSLTRPASPSSSVSSLICDSACDVRQVQKVAGRPRLTLRPPN